MRSYKCLFVAALLLLGVRVTAQSDISYAIQVAVGSVPGTTSIQKFGRNDDIDSQSGVEDLWAGGGQRAYLESAETMVYSSSSANDAAQGTGCRTLHVQGLDGNYDLVEEVVTMGGQGDVTGSQPFLRINRAFCDEAGSDGSNDGDMTIDPSVSGSGSRQVFIAAGDGQTLLSHYTVPNGYTAYMVGSHISVGPSGNGSGTRDATVRLWMRPFGGAWRLQSDFKVNNTGTSVTPNLNFTVPLSFASMTDIKWTGEAGSNNTSVYAQYSLILIDN